MIIEIDDDLIELLRQECRWFHDLLDDNPEISMDESFIRVQEIVTAIRILEGFVKNE